MHLDILYNLTINNGVIGLKTFLAEPFITITALIQKLCC